MFAAGPGIFRSVCPIWGVVGVVVSESQETGAGGATESEASREAGAWKAMGEGASRITGAAGHSGAGAAGASAADSMVGAGAAAGGSGAGTGTKAASGTAAGVPLQPGKLQQHLEWRRRAPTWGTPPSWGLECLTSSPSSLGVPFLLDRDAGAGGPPSFFSAPSCDRGPPPSLLRCLAWPRVSL